MDINKPITNPDLLIAMQEMKKDKAKESQFITELFKATFLCPAQIDTKNEQKGEGGKVVLGEGTTISLLSIESRSGESYLMAFTDWNELRKWKNDSAQQTLLFSFEDYKSIVLGENSSYQGIVINPFGDNILFSRDMLKNLKPQQEPINDNKSVMIGLPQEYPTDMVKKLTEYFHHTKRVNIAYLLWMVKDEEASYLLVLDSKLSPQELFPAVGELCRPCLDGKLLDMIPLNSPFGKSAVEKQQPFYKA